jgi:hypothetical protein
MTQKRSLKVAIVGVLLIVPAEPELVALAAAGPEIQAYFQRVADERGIRPHIRFSRAGCCTDGSGNERIQRARESRYAANDPGHGMQ